MGTYYAIPTNGDAFGQICVFANPAVIAYVDAIRNVEIGTAIQIEDEMRMLATPDRDLIGKHASFANFYPIARIG